MSSWTPKTIHSENFMSSHGSLEIHNIQVTTKKMKLILGDYGQAQLFLFSTFHIKLSVKSAKVYPNLVKSSKV